MWTLVKTGLIIAGGIVLEIAARELEKQATDDD